MDDDFVPPVLTSLDPSETKSHPLRTQSAAQNRIHCPVAVLRSLTINALWGSGDERLTHRAEKLGMCCIAPTVFVGKGCVPTCSPGRCRDRMCPTCSLYRAGTLRSRVTGLVARASGLRFMTLSRPMTDEPLQKRIDDLHAAFRRLRATKSWRNYVKGGLFILEVTRGKLGDFWHVHLHILVDGDYYPFDVLRQDWSNSVGAPAIVDVRAVYDRAKAAGYLTKYLAKGTDVEKWSASELCEYALALHRRRVVGTFGKWHKCRVDVLDENAPAPERATNAVAFSDLDLWLRNHEDNRRSAVPLLSRLSRTWRLLVAPYRTGLEWIDEDLSLAELETLTDVMLQFAAPLVAPEPTPVRSHKPRPDTPGLFGTPHHI
jgi:Replication protein